MQTTHLESVWWSQSVAENFGWHGWEPFTIAQLNSLFILNSSIRWYIPFQSFLSSYILNGQSFPLLMLPHYSDLFCYTSRYFYLVVATWHRDLGQHTFLQGSTLMTTNWIKFYFSCNERGCFYSLPSLLLVRDRSFSLFRSSNDRDPSRMNSHLSAFNYKPITFSD